MLYLTIVSLIAFSQFVNSTNYCAMNLCEPQQKHIGCNNTGIFAMNCGTLVKLVPMTTELKAMILKELNTYRNRIAGGLVPGYSGAKRMGKLKWDDELEQLAEYNVKLCGPELDACHNTDQFTHSSQIAGYYAWPDGLSVKVRLILKATFKSWFHQQKQANRMVMEDYHLPPKGKAYGHFATMIQEKNTHIGCAITRATLKEFVYQYLTCNFGRTVLTGFQVYESGRPASGCKTGRDWNFNYLCSAQEEYNVNDY